MAASPEYKIYSADGEYRGCVKYAEDACALAAGAGAGSTVRLGHAKKDTLLTMTDEYADSVDVAAEAIHEAEDALRARYARA